VALVSHDSRYRSLGPLTGSLAVLVSVQILGALGNFAAVNLLRCCIDDPRNPGMMIGRLVARTADPIVRGCAVASLVVFCFWVYRAYRNLEPLGSRQARFTPASAVGWFFVPFVVVVRGVQVMRDLWIESQPLDDDQGAMLPRRAPLVGWWWCVLLLTLMVGRSVAACHVRSTDRAEWLLFADQVMFVSVLQVIAGGLFLAVVLGIARRQHAQRDDLVRRQPTPPRSDLLR
jgi:hypothetical protein